MIKRKLYLELIDHLPQKEMTLIIGPRQAGKTTLMEMVKEHLDHIGERTLLLNLDLNKSIKIKKTALFFIPFHELLRHGTVL